MLILVFILLIHVSKKYRNMIWLWNILICCLIVEEVIVGCCFFVLVALDWLGIMRCGGGLWSLGMFCRCSGLPVMGQAWWRLIGSSLFVIGSFGKWIFTCRRCMVVIGRRIRPCLFSFFRWFMLSIVIVYPISKIIRDVFYVLRSGRYVIVCNSSSKIRHWLVKCR